MRIFVTGAAGFIGASLCGTLLRSGREVCIAGLDNLDPYYDVRLKRLRLENVARSAASEGRWRFIEGDIRDRELLERAIGEFSPDIVVHLAAQAGVRHSLDNPGVFVENNVEGFFNVLEACRRHSVPSFIFASSSSVYGNSDNPLSKESDPTDARESVYAATKKCDEVLASAYARIYGMSCTALRFFTVYGPWGRPDMAYFKFTDRLLRGENIELYNGGRLTRDFTYIDDAVGAIVSCIDKAPSGGVYNVSGGRQVPLSEFVGSLCRALKGAGLLAGDFRLEDSIVLKPMMKGDVLSTGADVSLARRDLGYAPKTGLDEGLAAFAGWYRDVVCRNLPR